MRFPRYGRERCLVHSSTPATTSQESFGDHGEGETPSSIPNLEVKPFSADGTACGSVWESRTSPDILSVRAAFGRPVLLVHALEPVMRRYRERAPRWLGGSKSGRSRDVSRRPAAAAEPSGTDRAVRQPEPVRSRCARPGSQLRCDRRAVRSAAVRSARSQRQPARLTAAVTSASRSARRASAEHRGSVAARRAAGDRADRGAAGLRRSADPGRHHRQ